ncbi:YcaO-like family protein [Haloplanus aerogenes]|uniref:Bacteriocin biosynthesis protein SagD n=1 Tax=Haloplanus aerogenes TaxID=660522 RepID=A0A3M0D8S6_9EURY|nr:YcaO-like family protein [Haloplanus aerogenes]AZH26446.1 bacteriocin biosynthesis protein SagD [Haloplanus aerogenes]RMB18088.1 ribosomal protein S12 methylthiotransferase accessory factor [Haloplanus aerogenes]
MQIGIAGSGPAAESVRAALDDIDATATATAPDDLGSYPLGIVIAPAGAPAFEAADAAADRWLAVEIGGLGGHTFDLDAAVTIFDDGVDYRDLRDRVTSAVDEESEGDPTGGRSAVRLAGAIAGHRAISLLSGAELAGTVIEVPGGERRVLPVPRAETRDRTLRRTHREATLDDAVGRAERAVDDRVGLLTQVGERESFPAPYYLAATADTTVFSDVRAAPFTAGVDDDWDRAFMKALGEGLERYCAGVYRETASTEAAQSADTVAGGRAISPAAFVGVDDATDDPISWVPGEELATGDAVSLPAEFVHYPPPAEHHRPAITTGLGLGNSGVDALLSGLYEVVERDATMLAWYSTYEPLELAVDDEGFDALVDRARAERLSVTPLLLTADVDVPVVAVAVHREEEWPRFAVGSGANLDAAAAARSALAEALQNWMELRAMGPEQSKAEDGAIGHYADFPDAAASFIDADGTVPAAGVGPDPVPTGEAELEALIDRVRDAGLAPYAARITTPDVAALGFEAVRVLLPTAQPLFVDEPYFGERAETVPLELGYEPRLDRPFHPFP